MTSPPPVPDAPPRWEKELRPGPAAAGAAVLAALTWMVWSSTGSRLSLFVCAAALAAGILDVVWAQVATARVRLAVTANPALAVVADTVALTLSVDGPRQFVRLRLRSFAPSGAAVGLDLPAPARFRVVATAREVLTEVVVEVESRGLAGLVTCVRWRPVRLARPLAVGPRPRAAAEPLPELVRAWGTGATRPAPTGDVVRGVRPYLPGDPPRRVHWRATARAGDLVVKEVEDIGTARLVIALHLGTGGPAGERAAGRAAWYALEGLRRDYEVVLATTQRRPAGTVAAPVRSRGDVIRRLAAATAGAVPDLPLDQHPAGTVLLVAPEGDSWR